MATVPPNQGVWRLRLLAAAAAAVGIVIGMQLFSGSASESNHHNWAAVREASSRPPGEIRWQDAAGGVAYITGIPLGDEDHDPETTAAVQAGLAAGDDTAVAKALVSANVAETKPEPATPVSPAPTPAAAPNPTPATAPVQTPAAAPVPKPVPFTPPTLSPGMRAEIRRGDAAFFHLFLCDTCDEDGDVVEVLIDGEVFATVRLTNRGVTLSVPVSASGTTRIQIRGIYDGGGGITVGCRTSRGQGFIRVLDVGDVETIALIRK